MLTTYDVGHSRKYHYVITQEMIQKFAEVTGDYNPIHVDEAYAKTTKFGKCIAHGMLMGGFFSRCLVETFGGNGIYLGQDMKFTNPIYVGDEIEVSMTLIALRKEKGIGTVETLAKRKSNGDICVKGQAVIMMTAPIA
jgi:acyl dehydratase